MHKKIDGEKNRSLYGTSLTSLVSGIRNDYFEEGLTLDF